MYNSIDMFAIEIPAWCDDPPTDGSVVLSLTLSLVAGRQVSAHILVPLVAFARQDNLLWGRVK